MANDGAKHDVKGTVAKGAVALFLSDGATVFRRANSNISVGQGFPGDLGGIGLGENTFTAKEHSFRRGEEAFSESTHFVERYVSRAVVLKGTTDVPEIAHLTAIGIVAVDFKFTHVDGVAICRPSAAMIVTVFEDEVALGIDAGAEPVFVGWVVGFDRALVVGVVIVENVEAPRGDFRDDGVGGLRTNGGFDVNRIRPGEALILAAQGNDVLPADTFVAGASRERANPRAVGGMRDEGLIAVVFGGDLTSVSYVAPIRWGHNSGER